jgi:hypothetical protein
MFRIRARPEPERSGMAEGSGPPRHLGRERAPGRRLLDRRQPRRAPLPAALVKGQDARHPIARPVGRRRAHLRRAGDRAAASSGEGSGAWLECLARMLGWVGGRACRRPSAGIATLVDHRCCEHADKACYGPDRPALKELEHRHSERRCVRDYEPGTHTQLPQPI